MNISLLTKHFWESCRNLSFTITQKKLLTPPNLLLLWSSPSRLLVSPLFLRSQKKPQHHPWLFSFSDIPHPTQPKISFKIHPSFDLLSALPLPKSWSKPQSRLTETILTASSIDLPASVLRTRVIVQKLRYDHGSPGLQSLQWLPAQVRAQSTASSQLCYPNLTPFSLLTQSRPLQPPCWSSPLQSSPHVRIFGHTLPSTSKALPSWKCMACSLTFFRTCLNITFVSKSSMTSFYEKATPLPYSSIPSSSFPAFPKLLILPADILRVFVCMCLFAHLYQNVSSVRVKVLSPVFTHIPPALRMVPAVERTHNKNLLTDCMNEQKQFLEPELSKES